jgi:hypothetical protein
LQTNNKNVGDSVMDKSLECPESGKLPEKASPVSLQRKSVADGTIQEENHEWLPFLADGAVKHCVGKDPMTIPLEVLTASGHPRRWTRRLVDAFAKGAGVDCLGHDEIKEYADIRRLACLPCLDGNDAEVRRCSTINCPFWPYRMGRNPHNPQRGKAPLHLMRGI